MTASFPLSNATTNRSPLLGANVNVRTAADAQATLANRLAERLGLPAGSLNTAKQNDFSPEKVADRVLGFIEQRVKSEAAAGADPAKLQKLMDQARSGIEKGFDEARKILDGMGMLKDKVASDIDDTYQRIQGGLAGLDKQYLNAAGGSTGTTGLTGSERMSALAESFELDITTREGDRLKVSIAQASANWSSQNASGSQSGSVQIGAWQVQVDGDLNDQEKAALEKLFTQVQDISSSFYSGDLAGAFDRAMALDMDSSQLASMSLRLTQTSVRQATDTYGSVSSQGGQPASAVNGALTDYAQSLLDALRTAGEVTGDGKGLLQQLLKGGFSLDERFDSTRLDKADQLNDRLLDGLQGMLASTLQPQARDDQAN